MGLILAHRGMPGALQNTREGVRRALEHGYEGIEVDLVLSKDGRLVLSHDPWLHPDYVEGGGEDQLICRMTWAEIRERTVSGYAALELAELLEMIPGGVSLYLDVKIERPRAGLTATGAAYAEALRRTCEGRVPLLAEAADAGIAAQFQAALPAGTPIYLSWPRYTAKRSGTLRTLGTDLLELVGCRDPVRAVREAGVRGYTAHRIVADDREISRAIAAGVEVAVFGVDHVVEARALCELGAHVIVDHTDGRPG